MSSTKNPSTKIVANISDAQDILFDCHNMLYPLNGILLLLKFYFNDKEEVRAGAGFSEDHYLALSELSKKAEEMVSSIQKEILHADELLDSSRESLKHN